ncbi:MAG: hypothetical protein JHC33_00860 [Ignisphaera sp.]|nr:hypothetical protein [Ignisphaera sp.]
MRKKLLILALLTTAVSATSTFADPSSAPNSGNGSSPAIGNNSDINKIIDLSNATSDYKLQPGEMAIIKFTDATTVPLHIAVEKGLYKLYANAGGFMLAPNNTAYPGAFWLSFTGDSNNTQPNNYYWYPKPTDSSYLKDSSNYFYIGNLTADGIIVAYIDTSVSKVIFQHVGIKDGKDPADWGTTWNDDVIRSGASHWIKRKPWTSLGTITFSKPRSGYFLIKRMI